MAGVGADYVIEADDLAAGYTETLILDGVSVAIHRGLVTCVIGGSGCGKSTLLRSAIGLLAPRRGSVRVLGHDIYTLSERDRSALLSRVGLMFQYGALLGSITVGENLAIPLRAHTRLPREVVEDVIRMKLAMVNLPGCEDKLPSELSGGMRKRAGLARAIVLDPELLLCDEPSAGLDPQTMAGIDALLLHLKRLLGITVVVITHELSSIKNIADRIVMLRDERLYFDGTLAEALASADPVVSGFFQRQAQRTSGQGRSLYAALMEGTS